MKTALQELPWDSKFFGMPIGQAEIGASAAAEIPALLGDARKKNLQCVYLFCDQEIHPAPGFLAEVRCYYEKELPLGHGDWKDIYGVSWGLAREEQLSKLKHIAHSFASQSRFFHDARFSSKCIPYYEQYVEKEFQERYSQKSTLLSAQFQGETAGFVSLSKESDEVSRIVLIAVDPDQQRKGIGKTLLHAAESWDIQHYESKILTVRTQEANHASCRLYESAGFLLKRNQWIYHCP